MRNIASLTAALFVTAGSVASADPQSTRLDDLSLAGIKQGWGAPMAGVAMDGPPLRVAGRLFAFGIGTHAPSVWKLPLAGKATEFRAWVGVQEYANNPGVGSVEFIVRGDERILWRSGVMRGKDPAREVRVTLDGEKELALEVTDANAKRFDAEVSQASAKLSMEQAYLELRFALGLGPIDEELPK